MDRKPLTSKCNWPSHTGNRALPLPPETLMHPLPLHLMWLVALAKAERRSQIAGKVVDLLDVGQEGLVDGLLVRYPAAGHLLLLFILSAPNLQHPETFRLSYLCLLALLEESLLASLLLGLVGGEVLGGGNLVDLGLGDTGQVDLEGCGDDVSRVDATEGDTVDLEGAGDEEDALVEGLEEDDALATEATGEEDQDGAGSERLAGSPRPLDLADLREIAMSVNSPDVQTLPPPIVLSRAKMPLGISFGIPICIGRPPAHTRRVGWRCKPSTAAPSPKSRPRGSPVCKCQREGVAQSRTLRGLDSSSAGYHFWAFSAAAGTDRVDLPNCFDVDDILVAWAVL